MRAAFALSLALVLDLVAASAVLAAISGSATPAAARQGDWVELTTDAPAGPHTYDNLAADGPTPIYLQAATSGSTGNDCSTEIGQMTWSGGVGTLRFQVPAVAPGTYWVLAGVQGGCWRFGAAEGILTVTVLPAPASTLPLAAIAVAIGLCVSVVIGALVRRRLNA